MATANYPYFSRTGWVPFGVSAALGLVVAHYLGWIWSLPLWIICAVIVYIFRDPDREIPSSPLAVVSPADGVVNVVEEVQDPYLGRRAIRVAIAMKQLGVFGTRSPIEGKVLEPPHSENGQPHGVWLRTDEQDDLVVVMHRGPLNNLPQCYVRIGERLGQGQRCGYITMGGLVEIYLPANSRIQVEQGSQVRSGSDVIAILVHK
jgi:phosphatidylserine decarboxylase